MNSLPRIFYNLSKRNRNVAKAKSKAKRQPKSKMIGHNSDDQNIKDEILKVAKAQRKLDNQKAEIRAEEKKLKQRLAAVDVTLQQFRPAYVHYCDIADANDDADAKRIHENHQVFLAGQRKCFDALSVGGQIDWIDLVQNAEDIQKLREEEEREAAKAAAEAGEEPEETAADI